MGDCTRPYQLRLGLPFFYNMPYKKYKGDDGQRIIYEIIYRGASYKESIIKVDPKKHIGYHPNEYDRNGIYNFD